MSWSGVTLDAAKLAALEPGTYASGDSIGSDFSERCRRKVQALAASSVGSIIRAWGVTETEFWDEIAEQGAGKEVYDIAYDALHEVALWLTFRGQYAAVGNADYERAQEYEQDARETLRRLDTAVQISIDNQEMDFTSDEITRWGEELDDDGYPTTGVYVI